MKRFSVITERIHNLEGVVDAPAAVAVTASPVCGNGVGSRDIVNNFLSEFF